MAKIRVLLHGNLAAELNLVSGQEYFAGRGSNCQIILANERGISRQHVKIFEQNNLWCVQLTSKYGGLVYNGQTTEFLELSGSTQFSVPPYEFIYEEDIIVAPAPEDVPSQKVAQADLSIESNDSSAPVALDISPADHTGGSNGGNLDATVAGASTLVAYLKIVNTKTRTEEILKLEGNVWAAGRHPTCEIVINDSAISRKHFDISRTPEGYHVTDHGSSNGTKVNGEKIPASTPFQIISGDVITVRHIEIIFEIHDGEYENRMNLVPSFADNAELSVEYVPPTDENQPDEHGHIENHLALRNQEHGNMSPPVLRIPPSQQSNSHGFKPNKLHYIIGGLLVVVVYGLISNDTNKSNQPPGVGTTESPSKTPTAPLSAEKQKEVQDVFNLAHGYYLQRKYTLCLSNLEKLHSMTAFHANSKEVENLCRQALELEQIEMDRQRKEAARVETENRIRKTVADCRLQLKPTTTTDEMTACLSPALELDPQNSAATDLLLQVQVQEQTKNDKVERQIAFNRRKQEGQKIYNRAMSLYKSGKLKEALKEFRRYSSGRYPGLNQLDDEASRNITSIQSNLDQELAQQIALCQGALERSDLKTAIMSCNRVLKENPGNAQAIEIKNKAFAQLRREMKPLYEDSVLEESMGNIQAAKEKWQKIIQSSVPQDDYYKKANQKLKKYGLGN